MPENNELCTIVSLVPFPIREEKPGLIPPRFVIPPSENYEPVVLHVTEARYYVYLDDSRGSIPVFVSPQRLAQSICFDYCQGQLAKDESCGPAIFWVPGKHSAAEVKLKFKAEMTEAKARQQEWFLRLARMADDDFTRYQKHNAVSDTQRIAARYLNWNPKEHPWMSPETIEAPERCPSCATLVPPKVVVCPNCKCVLKPEEFKKLQFA